jgi:hypothetical protein
MKTFIASYSCKTADLLRSLRQTLASSLNQKKQSNWCYLRKLNTRQIFSHGREILILNFSSHQFLSYNLQKASISLSGTPLKKNGIINLESIFLKNQA